MKKFVFSLVAMATFSFASATEIKNGESVKEKATTEIASVENESVKETEEFKTVQCESTVGTTTYYHSYSCFFCWGGAEKSCKAELLDIISDLTTNFD